MSQSAVRSIAITISQCILTALLLRSLSFLFIFYQSWHGLYMCLVIYFVYFTYRCMVDDMKQRRKSCNLRCVTYRGMVNNTKRIRKSCNLSCVIHHGMIDDTKQIRKSCNLHRLLCCGTVSFLLFSITVCALSTTRNLRG